MLDLTIDFRPESLSEDCLQLRVHVREFLREELAAGTFEPMVDCWLRGFDLEFSRRLGSRGWVGMTLPRDYGGHARTHRERFVVIEELLAAGAPVAAHWTADRQMAHSICRFGTEAQKLKMLPLIARGGCVFAAGYSEPDVGSDLASVRTRAEQIDGGWRISGTKVWASHAHHADYFLVLCRTAARSEDKHEGLSVLIVELPNPNFHVRPVPLMSGEHHFNEIVLDGVEVANDMVLGEVGQGWKIVTSEMALERSGPERFLSTYPLLVEMARRADQSGCRSTCRTVAELFARLWTLRSMSLVVATALEHGGSPNVEAAIVKDMGTRFEKEVGESARHLFSVEPYPDSADVFVRHLSVAIMQSPAYTLRGGTNEILRGIIAREIGLR